MMLLDGSALTFIDSVHYIGDETGNWFAVIQRGESGPWQLDYRFREYRDDKASWDGSIDPESHYRMTTSSADDAALARCREAIGIMRPVLMLKYGGEIDVVELQCWNNDPKVIFELGAREWTRMKYEPKGASDATDNG